MRFLDVLIDSFVLLGQQPKLFLPKILVAFLYGALMLAIAQATMPLAPLLQGAEVTAEQVALLGELRPLLLIMLVSLFAVLAIDVLVNAMFPPMVEDAFAKRKISFMRALRSALGKFFVVMPAIALEMAIFFLFAIPLITVFYFFQIQQNVLGTGISMLLVLLLILAVTIAFYLLYPVSVFERKNSIASVLRTFSLSRKNLADISKASLVQFAFSLISFALAFMSEAPAALALFIASRFFIAVLATYVMVLNPVFYIEFERGAALRK